MGNRRSANIRSKGYSDLFSLSKVTSSNSCGTWCMYWLIVTLVALERVKSQKWPFGCDASWWKLLVKATSQFLGQDDLVVSYPFWSGRPLGRNGGIQGGEGDDAWYRKADSFEGVRSVKVMLKWWITELRRCKKSNFTLDWFLQRTTWLTRKEPRRRLQGRWLLNRRSIFSTTRSLNCISLDCKLYLSKLQNTFEQKTNLLNDQVSQVSKANQIILLKGSNQTNHKMLYIKTLDHDTKQQCATCFFRWLLWRSDLGGWPKSTRDSR